MLSKDFSRYMRFLGRWITRDRFIMQTFRRLCIQNEHEESPFDLQSLFYSMQDSRQAKLTLSDA